MRRILFALAAQGLAAGAAVAADPPAHPLVAPLVTGIPCPPTPCPPGGSVPGGGTPSLFPNSQMGPGGSPNVPGGPDSPAVNPSDLGGGFARQSEGGTQVARSFAPNMFGDVLGARSLRFGYQVPFFCRFGIDPGTTTTGTGGAAVTINPNAAGTRFEFGGPTAARGPLTPVVVPGPFSNTDLRFAQPVGNPVSDTAFTTAAIQSLMSAGQLTPSQVAAFSQLTPAQQAQLLRNRGAINNTITQGTRGLAVRTVTLSDLTVTTNGNFADCVGVLNGTQNVALPGGSTFIGRVKMSEDTSPLPRDRVLFAYDNFNSVPLTPDGFTVNRFQLGIEKTFLDGRWSAEFRLPFAGTIASTNVQGFEIGNVELGNLRFALKRIITQNDVLTTTTGIAMTLPTAADQVILSSLDGSELYRFRNQQVTLEPFIAALLTPNARLFSQTWASLNFDVSGGELTYSTAVFGGSGRERLYDVPYLSVDHQIGYWLVRRDTGRLRGLAPFVELHWNYAIAQDQLIRAVNDRLPSNGLAVGGVATHELNLVAGLLLQLGDNLNVSVGASAPLLQKPERTFDAQVGVRVNYLYGRTAQARNPINAIGTY